MKSEAVAHVDENGREHLLEEHLWETARLAGDFAAVFECGQWGRLAGLWHDLGKYSERFQKYIRSVNDPNAHVGKNGGDHSTAGALYALETLGPLGLIFGYPIAGHHAGMPDWNEGGMASLAQRLQQKELLDQALTAGIPIEILNQAKPTERAKSGTDMSQSFWLRMLFSCVVDADFLDTEKFFNQGKTPDRGGYPPLTELLPLFNSFMEGMQAKANNTTVNSIRAEILKQCMAKSQKAPGLFSLTVPTGGGKTLSSLAFGLNHAVTHGQRRIIYVIPYTSIIEQTANQFREIWEGLDVVIEHHSNLDVDNEQRDNARSRLACENWDAPVIVTTTVQFTTSARISLPKKNNNHNHTNQKENPT